MKKYLKMVIASFFYDRAKDALKRGDIMQLIKYTELTVRFYPADDPELKELGNRLKRDIKKYKEEYKNGSGFKRIFCNH